MDYDLSHLQRWMQSVITHASGVEAGIDSDAARQSIDVTADEVERVVNRSQACTSADRLRVYANAYYSRLIDCLRESFPCMVFAIGQEAFDEFAFGYLQRYPSTSYTLSDLGDHFADYLQETRPVAGQGEADWADFLIDLAKLEWQIERVFDGPGFEDQPTLTPQWLLELDADAWPKAKLEPAVCLRLLEFRFPVNQYYTEYRDGRKIPQPKPQPDFVALTRRDYVVRRIALDELQFQLLQQLCAGCSVEESIHWLAETSGDEVERLASKLRAWFQQWARAGLFRRLKL